MVTKTTSKFNNVVNEIRKSDVTRVKLAASDIDGVLRGKYVHKDKFLSAAENGFGFCNVVFGWDSSDNLYDNCKYTGWQTGYPDVQTRVDLATHRRVPWDDNVSFFLCDFETGDGEPLAICPRQLLKRIIATAQSMGLNPIAGVEYEWFNFRETPASFAAKDFRDPQPLSPGMFGYSIVRASQNQPYFKALMDEMAKFGVPLEGLHTETGPGVFEAAILYSDALEAADRAVLFKTAAKEIGQRFSIMPSFMAKWNVTLPGCSGHLHQSLQDTKSGKNVFHDERDKHKMSETFKMYLAGQIHCAAEILPMWAPTVNSYKRLVDGYWAPTKPTWGLDNRTASFRVISGSPKSTRLETRVPGADINPYLALAAAIASGLYGIASKMKLKAAPVEGSGYLAEIERFPRNLLTATEKMANSKIAKELFGTDFVEHFVNTRAWEWRQFQDAVTDWEFKRYFEII
jgi:glutamine synthetase